MIGEHPGAGVRASSVVDLAPTPVAAPGAHPTSGLGDPRTAAPAPATRAPGAGRRRGRRGKQIQFLVCGGVVLLAIAWLAYTALGTTMVYYVTIPELRAMGDGAFSRSLRVAGVVADRSIQRDSQTSTIKFTISDGKDTLPVTYRGVVPDIFGDGIEVVVEGHYRSSGVFEAQTLLARCPSRFESAPLQGAPGATMKAS